MNIKYHTFTRIKLNYTLKYCNKSKLISVVELRIMTHVYAIYLYIYIYYIYYLYIFIYIIYIFLILIFFIISMYLILFAFKENYVKLKHVPD